MNQDYDEVLNDVMNTLKKIENETGRFPSISMLKKLKEYETLYKILKYNLNNTIWKNPNRSKTYINLKDEIVKSSYELLFSNFLFINNIEYEYNKPIISSESSKVRYKYDFKIINKDSIPLYFEIWGYFKPQYKLQRLSKEIFYKENNLKLISIEPSLFENNSYKQIYYSLEILLKDNNIISNNSKEYNEKLFITGYYLSIDYIKKKLNPIINELGRMPTSFELRNKGLNSIDRYISKFGGMKKVAKELGVDSSNIRNNWNDKDAFKQFEELCHLVGYIPSERDFQLYHKGKLLAFLKRNKDIKINFINKAKSAGFKTYNEINNIHEPFTYTKNNGEELIKELSSLVALYGYLPSVRQLESLNKDYLDSYILKFGGRNNVAKKLNTKTFEEAHNIKENGFWDFDGKNLFPLVIETSNSLGHIPSLKELKDKNLHKLIYPIRKFGGLSKLSEKLNIPTYEQFYNIKYTGYWDKEGKRLSEEILKYCDILGYIPTDRYLREHNRHDLIGAIRRFGNRERLSKLIGYPTYLEKQNVKEAGYWDRDGTKLAEKILPICKDLGYIPTRSYLENTGNASLEAAIQRFGGRKKLAKLINFQIFPDYISK